MKRAIGVTIISILMIIVMIMGGCSAAYEKATSDSAAGYDMEAEAYPAEPAEDGAYYEGALMSQAEEGGFGGGGASRMGNTVDPVQAGSKIIKTGYLTIETLEFDDTNNRIVSKVNSLGGFVSSSNVEGQSRRDSKRMRYAYYEVRIPSQSFDQFLTDMGDLGDIIRNEKRGEDITGQYYDTESRLNSLKVQEERLITILSEAVKLQDILELERELSRVRYEIENHTGTLKKWDNLVNYSTINIEVIEVEELRPEEITPGNYWERISSGFLRSVHNVFNFLKLLVIFIAASIPYIILLAIPTVPALIIAGKIKKNNKSKSE